MTTQATLRSRRTKAESVYHVQITGDRDAPTSPLVKIQGWRQSGYSRRRDRSPRRCCRTVHESFHLTRLLKRVVRVRHTVDARAPSSPRGNTDATVASSCTHLAHRLLVG
jgi:hypothetical protein